MIKFFNILITFWLGAAISQIICCFRWGVSGDYIIEMLLALANIYVVSLVKNIWRKAAKRNEKQK